MGLLVFPSRSRGAISERHYQDREASDEEPFLDPTDLANSVDPGELLEAGSTFNLSNIFYQVSLLAPHTP
jgi:hypothetical protein